MQTQQALPTPWQDTGFATISAPSFTARGIDTADLREQSPKELTAASREGWLLGQDVAHLGPGPRGRR